MLGPTNTFRLGTNFKVTSLRRRKFLMASSAKYMSVLRRDSIGGKLQPERAFGNCQRHHRGLIIGDLSLLRGSASRSHDRKACIRARRAKHPVNPSPQKYSTLPKFGNGVCVAVSRLILEGRSRVVLFASRVCGGRGQRWAREARAGRVVPVSPKPRADERRCQVRLASNSSATSTRPGNIAANKRAVRTAKPCGPGRRRYGQAFAEVWSAQPGQPHRQFAKRGRPEGIRLPGERGISRQPTAQGRPSDWLHLYAAVRFSCAPFSRSRPRVPAGARPSLRPLGQAGGTTKQSSGGKRRESAKAFLQVAVRVGGCRQRFLLRDCERTVVMALASPIPIAITRPCRREAGG